MKRLCVFGLVAVVGCSQETHVSALFTKNAPVSSGADVRFEQNVIGEVERVSQEGDGTRAFLALDPSKSQALMKGAAALIVGTNGASNVEIFNIRSGQQLLSDGDELVALNNTIEYVAWQSRETLDFTQNSLSEFTESMQNYFGSQQWEQHKKQMEQSLTQFGAEAQSAMTEMQQNYEALVKGLETQSKQSREAVEQQLKELTTTLQQQIQELLQNGEDALADSLQQFLDMLEQVMKRYSELKGQQKTSGATT